MHELRPIRRYASALAVLAALSACGAGQSSSSPSSGGGGAGQGMSQTCGGLASPADGGLLTPDEVLDAVGGTGLTVTANRVSDSTPPAYAGCRFDVKDSGGKAFAGVTTELFHDSSVFDDVRRGKYGTQQTVPVGGVGDGAYYVLDPDSYDVYLYARRSGRTFEIHAVLVRGSVERHEAIEKQLAVVAAGRL